MHLLHKKAIKAAIEGNWELAIQLNTQIMQEEPDNVDVKNRMGKAYLELGEFNKAKKYSRQVLESDPINLTAQKNLEMAKDNKHQKASLSHSHSIIKEPGTFAEVQCTITAKRVMAENLAMGEDFSLGIERNTIRIYWSNKSGDEVELCMIDDPKITKKVYSAKTQKAKVSAKFGGGNGKDIKILIHSSIPLFIGEKQEIKPYMKRAVIEDSDLEVPEIAE